MSSPGSIQPQSGLVSGYQGGKVSIEIVMAVFAALALYNAIELTILVFTTFHRYAGLYFWALLLSCAVGVIPTAIANILHFYAIGPLWFAMVLSTIGFYFMVPGQSLVLYSRLHLVLYNERILRTVLYVVIIGAVCILTLTTTTTFGSAYVQTPSWNEAYAIVERLQLTWFFAQELLLSSLYIWEAVKLLKLLPETDSHRKTIMCQLLLINIVIVVLDVPAPLLEYAGFYYLEVSLKPTIYSIKLRLEFAILGRLVSIVSHHITSVSSGEEGHVEFSGPTLHSDDGLREPQSTHTK